MKALFALVLLALLASAFAQLKSYQSCGSAADTLSISSLTLTPNPPVIGQTLNVNVQGSLKQTIVDGHVAVLVFFNGIQLLSTTLDMCTAFGTAVQCPINAGNVNLNVAQTIPVYAPPGEYTGQLTFHDQTGAEIACVKFDYQMSASAAFASGLALDDEMIAHINSDSSSTWVAGRNDKFDGLTLEDAKKFLGTDMTPMTSTKKVLAHAASIPTEFDSRKQWPHCVHPIRNQQHCGSCWAFGATEALSDRFCIASSGKVNVVLSPQWMVSCDLTNHGCQGGNLEHAWAFMEQTGVVEDSCFPYSSGSGTAPACISKCVNGSPLHMYKVRSGSIHQPADVASIQTLIMTSGPVEAGFSVYQDFFSYKSGVYQHKSGALAGGHAIKIVGWGVDSHNHLPYWIVANSWGTSWGLDGYFWILRGQNECGIEHNIVAGDPAL